MMIKKIKREGQIDYARFGHPECEIMHRLEPVTENFLLVFYRKGRLQILLATRRDRIQ
jgi:hypothetical protein